MRCFVFGIVLLMLTLRCDCGSAQDAAKPTVREITSAATGMKLILIPAGEFTMGSTSAELDLVEKRHATFERDSADDEQPAHLVRITRPFYMGKLEVTKAQFARFVASQNYVTEPERDRKGGWGYNSMSPRIFDQHPKYLWNSVGWEPYDDAHPVVNVTWNDAQAFCKWLSETDGNTYRLPTEAEWEYACRAGTTTQQPAGDDWTKLVSIGNVQDRQYHQIPGMRGGSTLTRFEDGFGFTAPAGSYKANAFGLHDLIGNVREWCADVYDRKAYSQLSAVTLDPLIKSGSDRRVCRGGSWQSWLDKDRSAARNNRPPNDRAFDLGFRVIAVRDGKP